MWLHLFAYAFVFVTFWLALKSGEHKVINGIYGAADGGVSYHVKRILFKILLNLRRISDERRRRKRRQSDKEKNFKAGLGKEQYSDKSNMDRPQPLSDHPKAFDAIFFSGASVDNNNDKNNNFSFIAAMIRRKNNICDTVLYIKNDLGYFRGSWMPRVGIESADDNKFRSLSGMNFEVVEPMREWKIEYMGKVKRIGGDEEELDVEFSGTYTSNQNPFNYDTDMDADATARAFAKEAWNEQFFKDLENAHQSHYEQLGTFKGRLRFPQLEGEAYREVMTPSFRDHSFGIKRDWKLMHRYFFHQIFLPTGWKCSVGVVCQPHTCTTLECGFVSLPNGNTFAVQSCDMKLHEHGEGGTVPNEYAFSMVAGNRRYEVEVLLECDCEHFYGEEEEARIVERFVQYKVDGIRGRGITEWQYRHPRRLQ